MRWNTLKIEVKWALLFTAMGLLWMVLERITGLHSTYLDYQMYLTNLFAIPAIAVMVAALRDKKKNFYHGVMTYKQGLISGSILSTGIALCSPAAQWITSYVISPHYFSRVIQRSVELGYYRDTAAAAAHFNYANFAVQGAIGAWVMGILTTAIAMFFIKSRRGQA
ncbi:DUF4199 domain-containing protein [Flavobacterium sp. JP2137]|uniref:DUF4199 domain-containing protein n=1 Tax=Flavobacterium sp. JP2137 TaxID=3414510 RepID=UPI003D2FBDCB